MLTKIIGKISALKCFFKKILDFMYLKAHGVDSEFGCCRLIGYPIIKRKKGSKIVIGKGVTIISKIAGNIAGVNNRVVLATLTEKALINIGDNSGISGSKLVSSKRISIGQYVGLGVNSVVYDTDFHPIESDKRRKQKSIIEAKCKEVEICDDVLIGANSIILKGSYIPVGVVIGAGSVVSGQKMNEYSVYAGNPLIKLKDIKCEK